MIRVEDVIQVISTTREEQNDSCITPDSKKLKTPDEAFTAIIKTVANIHSPIIAFEAYSGSRDVPNYRVAIFTDEISEIKENRFSGSESTTVVMRNGSSHTLVKLYDEVMKEINGNSE